MQYKEMIQGEFISRSNRFVANVLVDKEQVVCHVKNTGRCRELLIPGCSVWLQKEDGEKRKTAYSLIAVEKNGVLVNLDSQAPNQAAFEWIKEKWNPDVLQREKTYGKSRFDLYLEKDGRRIFVEVKGVTLEVDGTALFPDAPTERGIKHIRELMACREDGYEACLLFVIQMKGVNRFMANENTHPEFARCLREAAEAGVEVAAMDCIVTKNSIRIDKRVPVVVN